mgnify:CR=1 FL=1
MSTTTKDNYDQLVDDAWKGMEEAIVALGRINDILYPDGEPGQFRCPRNDVALLEAKIKEMTQEHATMKNVQAARNVRPDIPDFLKSVALKK